MASELVPASAARFWLMARAMLTAPIGNRAMMASMPIARMPMAISTSISEVPGRRVCRRIMAPVLLSPPRSGEGESSSQPGPAAVAGEHVRVRDSTRRNRRTVVQVHRGHLPGPCVNDNEQPVIRPVHVLDAEDQLAGRGVRHGPGRVEQDVNVAGPE